MTFKEKKETVKLITSFQLKNYFHDKEAIKNSDKSYLKRVLRYDQKLTIKLFEVYTGKKLPSTNKQISLFIDRQL